MAANQHPGDRFTLNISALIAEIESCLEKTPSVSDRESTLQREAFRERSNQARCLVDRLAARGANEWSLCSGEAHRLQESLQLSLRFFRRNRRG